jgi:hypothetical protein
MSYDWVPAGSVPYDTALCDGAWTVAAGDGSVPADSYLPYQPPPPKRDPKLCVGNDKTCKGYKSGGTDLCVGHQKAEAKQVAAALVAVGLR